MRWHVYVWRDPRPGKNSVPIYVGKGTSKRAHSMSRAYNRTLAGIRWEQYRTAKALAAEA